MQELRNTVGNYVRESKLAKYVESFRLEILFWFFIIKKAVSIYDFLILLEKARNAVKLKDRISEI